MYYLYEKVGKSTMPKFDYNFNNFADFYAIAPVLTRKLYGQYVIHVKVNNMEALEEFINVSDKYKHMTLYIQATDTVYKYIRLKKPGVSLLDSKNDYEIWSELIQRHGLMLGPGCAKKLFWAVKHTYEAMSEAILELKEVYGNQIVTMDMVAKVISIESIVYPRNALISYIRMDRFRKSKLDKCIEAFGNDIVFYSMRKRVDAFIQEKNAYFKTGEGSDLIKSLPYDNLLKLEYAFLSVPKYFKDIRILLNLYEKGEYLNDYLQEETI